MGQAMVDLPDPLESPPVKATVGADDLLAQMAGDEIDRLLAEAEADAPAYQNAPVSVVDDPQIHLASEPGIGAVAENPPSFAAIGAPARAAEESAFAGELDSLLESLTTASPRPSDQAPVPVSPAVQAIELEEAAATPLSDAGAGISSETSALLSAVAAEAVATGEFSPAGEATSAAERSALSETPAVNASGADAAQSTATDAMPDDDIDQDAPLPLLLRPLEWINAPLAACPDFLREFIGKAAILTVVNAAAILFYVRVIRRH